MAAADEEEESFHEAETQSLVAVDEAERVVQRVAMLENVIVDMFTTISALKNAYIQLQAAHSPYNADKLRAADRLVIGELRKLSELKHRLKGKSKGLDRDNSGKMILELQMSVKEKQAVIESYQKQTQQLERQAADDKSEIERLSELLTRANLKRDKLEKRLSEQVQVNSPVLNGSPSPSVALFEQAAVNARGQAFSFAKLLMGLMKNAEWDLEAAASSIQPGAGLARPNHTRLALESYVCHRMFNGFENENFYLSGSLSSILDPGKHRHECLAQFQEMKALHPMELLAASPDCMFGKFCHKKYLQLIHEKMEESFFGQLQQRNQILNGEHPESQFYQRFLELAKSVWLLHKLGFALNPTASIFQVRKDTSFHPDFMDTVGPDDDDSDDTVARTVSFTVMPGFRLDNSIVKCLVYLHPSSSSIP